MQLQIDEIQIGQRIRKTAGDISALKSSIEQVGLLNPIIVNEQHELISGFRRLEACRQLGWTKIEVKVVPTMDNDIQELDIEYHENVGRMNLTPEEQQDYSSTRYTLLHPPKPTPAILIWLKRLWQWIRSLFRR